MSDNKPERYPREVDFTYFGGPLNGQKSHTYPEICEVEVQEEFHEIETHEYLRRPNSDVMVYVKSRHKVITDTRLDRSNQ